MPRIMIDLICPLRLKHNWTTLIVLTALGSLVYCDPRKYDLPVWPGEVDQENQDNIDRANDSALANHT